MWNSWTVAEHLQLNKQGQLITYLDCPPAWKTHPCASLNPFRVWIPNTYKDTDINYHHKNAII